MKQRVRVQKSDAAAVAATQTNRLTNITVKEVSIVDRAANQRKYLVVKTEDGQPASSATTTPVPVPELKLSADVKAKVSSAVKAAQQKLEELAKAVDGAIVTIGASIPQDVVDSCVAICSDLASGCSMSIEQAPTEKSGRKISAARLKLLQDAKTSIDAIIEEVTAAESDETAPAVADVAADATVKSEKTTQPTAAPPAELDAVLKTVDKLAGAVSKMTVLFEGQNERLEALSKARRPSHQVDLDAETTTKSDEQVVWDMDMARTSRNATAQ